MHTVQVSSDEMYWFLISLIEFQWVLMSLLLSVKHSRRVVVVVVVVVEFIEI